MKSGNSLSIYFLFKKELLLSADFIPVLFCRKLNNITWEKRNRYSCKLHTNWLTVHCVRCRLITIYWTILWFKKSHLNMYIALNRTPNFENYLLQENCFILCTFYQQRHFSPFWYSPTKYIIFLTNCMKWRFIFIEYRYYRYNVDHKVKKTKQFIKLTFSQYLTVSSDLKPLNVELPIAFGLNANLIVTWCYPCGKIHAGTSPKKEFYICCALR